LETELNCNFMNISSIIVQTKPENLADVLNTVKNSDFCEYHLHKETGHIIVTVEGSGIEEEMKKLRKLQALPNVISAEMVYSYAENELDAARDKLDFAGIPKWLNDPNIKAEDIKYNGDLKKRL